MCLPDGGSIPVSSRNMPYSSYLLVIPGEHVHEEQGTVPLWKMFLAPELGLRQYKGSYISKAFSKTEAPHLAFCVGVSASPVGKG